MTGVALVVNANASGAPRGRRLDELIGALRAAGADVDVELTHSIEELGDVWTRSDGRRLVLAGGDGSVHAVANLEGPSRDIALIPSGRANNVAHSVGIPTDPLHAATLAAAGDVRPLDLIEARTPDRRYVVVESVSAGFLAVARTRYRGRNSADLRAGIAAGARALASFHPYAVRVAGPDGEEELSLGQLFVANLPLYEFGLRVAPHAVATDATLDLVGIEAAGRRAVLPMLVRLRRGTHMRHPGTHVWRAAGVVLSSNGSSPIVADSTDLGFGPVELTAMRGALRLVRP